MPFVFFHKDLDGVVSYLALCWAFDKKLPYADVASSFLVQNKIQSLKIKELLKNHSQVFFLNLDISHVSPELVNYPGVTVIDYHPQEPVHSNIQYWIANGVKSCSKAIYQRYKASLNLSTERKALIALADDYNSWKHSHTDSTRLNIVYHRMPNKVESFVNQFYNGFFFFTPEQLHQVTLHEDAAREICKDLQLYAATASIQGQPQRMVSFFTDDYIDECISYAFKRTKANLVFCIHRNTNRVFVRKDAENPIDLGLLCKKLLNGGGTREAAGGIVNEKFLQFSSVFKEV